MSFKLHDKVIDYGEVIRSDCWPKLGAEFTGSMLNLAETTRHAARQLDSLAHVAKQEIGKYPEPGDQTPEYREWLTRYWKRKGHSRPRPLMLRVFPKTIMLRLGRP